MAAPDGAVELTGTVRSGVERGSLLLVTDDGVIHQLAGPTARGLASGRRVRVSGRSSGGRSSGGQQGAVLWLTAVDDAP